MHDGENLITLTKDERRKRKRTLFISIRNRNEMVAKATSASVESTGCREIRFLLKERLLPSAACFEYCDRKKC